MRRPRRPEDYKEYSIVESFAKREIDFKKSRGNDLAFVFPASYRVAASSLAFSWVRDLLSSAGVGVERFFFHESFKKFYSLESLRPMDEFRTIAFSYQFETDLFNILEILRKRSIPLKWSDRGEEHPLIIVGGPMTYFNPSSVLPIADAVYRGDLEVAYLEFAEAILQTEKAGILRKLSDIPYIEIPSMSKRGVVAKFWDLNSLPPVGSVVSPDGEFKGKLLIEVGRGCIRRCAFCMIGHLQKPVRFVKPEVLEEILLEIPQSIPLGLISATITDYPWLEDLLDLLEGRKFSVSSMRLDRLTSRLLSMLRKSGQRSFTAAPEGGTQRIRDILRKDISDEDIERGLRMGREAGFEAVKMYFIYGVEEETEDDLLGIRDIAELAISMGYKSVRLSLNPLIPKSGTPFQGRRMQDLKTLKEKMKFLSSVLKLKGVKVDFESLKGSYVQYRIANMDPDEAQKLVNVFERDGRKGAIRWLLVNQI